MTRAPSPAVRYLVQGEYDYARAVEVDAAGTVRIFSGSYVTQGERARRLSPAERAALGRALAALPEPFSHPGDGPSLRHRLEAGGRVWTWRGGPDSVPAGVRPLAALLFRLAA